MLDIEGDAQQHVRLLIDGKPFDAELTDNAYDPDGYRFHDVFHFAYAAVLGWSPITRAFLRRKRKSQPLLDEVEDGGRAAVIEEGVVALALDYARRHHFLDGVAALDFQLLRTIKDMTMAVSAWLLDMNTVLQVSSDLMVLKKVSTTALS